MKAGHRLFIAIPFDAATRNQYDRIAGQLRQRYPDLTVVIAAKEIGPSPEFSEIATFKAQNRELHEQFTNQITKADIVIADLTHNNPNVHVELGIALMQNKNILRVTGRAVGEVGFDVRQLDVRTYKDEETLVGLITKYLDTFLSIKRLPLDPASTPLYSKVVPSESMNAINDKRDDLSALLDPLPNLIMRDGAVRSRFTMLRTVDQSDWFGVCFRVGGLTPWTGSHMVYVRQDGSVDLATYPGPQVVTLHPAGRSMQGEQELVIDFENDFLSVRIGEIEVPSSSLTHQRAGRVVLVAHRSEVSVASAEMVCRDTIEPDVY